MKRTLALLAFLTGCSAMGNGTETGNPKATETGNPKLPTRLAPGGWSSDPSRVSAGPGGAIEVHAAWLWVESIHFRRGEACEPEADDDDAPADLDATLLEVVGGDALTLRLPATRYCGVAIELEAAEAPPEAPPELDPSALVVEGALADGTPFRVLSEGSASWTLDGAFDLTRKDHALVLGFDVAGWFDGVDVASLPLEDGVLLLDDDTESDLLASFEDNLDASPALFADTDDDGALDLAETESPLAVPTD